MYYILFICFDIFLELFVYYERDIGVKFVILCKGELKFLELNEKNMVTVVLMNFRCKIKSCELFYFVSLFLLLCMCFFMKYIRYLLIF